MAETIRLMTKVGPRLLVGIGPGAVIAAGVASPRVVEAALYLRATKVEESRDVAPIWHSLNLVVLDSPLTFGRSRLETLQAAVPELFKLDARSIPMVWRRRMYPQRDFGRAFAAAVGASTVEQLGDGVRAATLLKQNSLKGLTRGHCAFASAAKKRIANRPRCILGRTKRKLKTRQKKKPWKNRKLLLPRLSSRAPLLLPRLSSRVFVLSTSVPVLFGLPQSLLQLCCVVEVLAHRMCTLKGRLSIRVVCSSRRPQVPRCFV